MGLLSSHYHVDNRTIYPETTHHHEHRAPTDESIGLACEMMDKSAEQVILRVDLENNILKGCILIMHADNTRDRHLAQYRFDLNGQSFIGYTGIDRYDIMTKNITGIRKFLKNLIKEEISKQIAEKLIDSIGSELALVKLSEHSR